MMKQKPTKVLSVAAITTMLMSGAAFAATVTKDLGGDVTCSYATATLDAADANDAGVSAATDCINIAGNGGNTKLDEMLGATAFGIGTWDVEDKIDLPALLGDYFEITVLSDPGEELYGTWSLLAGYFFPAGESFALALKGGSDSFVYLLDNAHTVGTWSTRDLTVGNNNQPDLSNITLFGTVAPIPLPAAGFLLLGALGALGLAARRRRDKAA